MKIFKNVHGSIFFLSAIAAVFNPVIEIIKLIYHGSASFVSLFEFFIFGLFTLLLIWIYLLLFSEDKIPANISNLLDTTLFRIILLILFLIIAVILSIVTLTPVLLNFTPAIKIWAGLCFSIFGALILDIAKINISSIFKPVFSLLVFTLSIFLLSKLLNINNYPLSLGWSETTHFAYGYSFYSAFTGENRILLPYMNHSRYLLLSIPWFFNTSDIIFHRFWETSLFITSTLLTAFLLVKRCKFKKPYNYLFFVWSTLFLLQCPIYYHLLIIPIIIVSTYNHNSKLKYLIIFLASIWAGYSRINWLLMPAAISVILYIYDTMKDIDNNQPWTDIKNSFAIGVSGLFGGILGYLLVYLGSNQAPQLLTSAFSSLLLWQRLLPSPAYGMGILLWIIIVTSPAIFLILYKNNNLSNRILKMRYSFVALILAIFFIGGLIVSVKIGGGSDIHNLDGFVLLLLIVILYELSNRLGFSIRYFEKSNLYSLGFTLLFLLPGIFTLNSIRRIVTPDYNLANQTINEIQEIIDTANKDNKEVLLGDQQHLILFGKLTGIEYNSIFEKTLITEAAISLNIKYLQQYNLQPMEDQFFGVLILEPQQWGIKDTKTDRFADENNYYIRIYSKEFRKYYSLTSKFYNNQLEIYHPIQIDD